MKFSKSLLILSLLLFLNACKQEKTSPVNNNTNTLIKYSKGFDIQIFDNYKKLIIKSPYPDAEEAFAYIIVPKGNEIPDSLKNHKIIRTPVDKLVVTSTTHIPMLELLEVENTLVGFPNLKYISSAKTRARIDKGLITELGNEESINTEILLDVSPELLIGFSMSNNNKMFNTIEKAGIPVVLNGDWLEETPLGRAEWIKFFAVFFDKEKEADSIFKGIEQEYIEAIAIAKKATRKPTVLSGVLFKDIWNLPAGDSFVAQFLKDANTDYLWADSEGKGSLSLSFESVYDKGQNAEFWIAPGHYNSLEQLENANEHYTKFEAFQKKNVFSFTLKKGETGGALYYELAPVQPHIVLKDIIKITHPELLEDYTPFYLELLQ
ncbi:ABC transporter substrate-binding protein [Aureibaculum sp. 2210JD6-5]|uniref:ABC transporter substrate-binding protein n=1 Tax=Aureibaculum sp. 2210JD6-5 TaxID=3103957 RepID=UPI002AAECC85|nr:ABC transporter substrate-binding protein [Aureibaculum sp. 2210JD6-5]MDY7394219.1 ABC transporter substrate-binding protein [Aureibaculum sp. 2210JD6-5]